MKAVLHDLRQQGACVPREPLPGESLMLRGESNIPSRGILTKQINGGMGELLIEDLTSTPLLVCCWKS